MNRKIDNILIGILWLLGITMASCFWFNTRFGFNLFSNAHWQYLATQQATRAPISFWFYFSFIVATFIALFGLYILIRPRKRNIKLLKHVQTQSVLVSPSVPSQSQPTPLETVTPSDTTNQPPLSRPPRLNIGPSNTFAPAQQTPVSTNTNVTNTHSQTPPTTDYSQLREIFSSAGYVIKKEPYINGKRMAVLAIGTGEVLYIGATDISTVDMQSCANKLAQIFSDTLDGVDIYINAFVINATDIATPVPDILTFDSINSLKQYMQEHRNPPLPDNDDGNFEAYSDYISTVIEYIGKL